MRTLTETGVNKIGKRLVDSVAHAAYTLDGQPKTIEIFRRSAVAGSTKVYVYFDDTISGKVANVQLVDTDGDVIATTPPEREFVKPTSKGLYVAFKYNIKEMETEVEINASI